MLRQVQSDRSNLAHGWLPFAADSITAVWHSDAARGPSTPSFDNLVGAQQERLRNLQSERLCGGEIYNEIELGRLLHRQIAWLRPAQNLVDIVPGASKEVGNVWSIGHQTTRFHELPVAIHSWQSRPERQGNDTNTIGVHERLATDIKRIRSAPEPLEGGGDLLGSPDFKCGRFKA